MKHVVNTLAAIGFALLVALVLAYVNQYLDAEQRQCFIDGLVRYDYCVLINNVSDTLSSIGLR